MSRALSLILAVVLGAMPTLRVSAQTSAATADDAIRVTVTVNADGSRTTY